MKLTNWLIAIGMTFISMSFVACNKDLEHKKEEKVKVSLSTILESVEFSSEALMTRTGNEELHNLYQIQIWYYPQGSTSKSPYAYGLFDDTSLATFELIKGYTYSFAVAVYTDGANKLSSFGGYTTYKYGNKHRFTTISNEAVYDSSNSLEVNNPSGIILKGSNEYTIPRIEKFYGVLDNIEVTEPINVSIDCKRVSFGLRVNVNNLTKGSILMENSSMGDITLTPEKTSFESIYSFYTSSTALKEGYDRGYGYPTKIYYVREDDMKELLYTLNEYQFRINQISNLTINLKSQDSDKTTGGVSVTLDSQPYTGDNIEINQE